jgi:hypothetical protein
MIILAHHILNEKNNAPSGRVGALSGGVKKLDTFSLFFIPMRIFKQVGSSLVHARTVKRGKGKVRGEVGESERKRGRTLSTTLSTQTHIWPGGESERNLTAQSGE